MMDAGLLVIATASNLNDDELRMLQTVMRRDSLLVINVGPNEFRDGTIDLNLNEKDTVKQNVRKIIPEDILRRNQQ